MILFYLWRRRLLAGMDSEKLRFFFGWTRNPLYLSRRTPLARSINWVMACFSITYARNLADWLSYRAALYDGHRG